jgi:hypothetical protein
LSWLTLAVAAELAAAQLQPRTAGQAALVSVAVVAAEAVQATALADLSVVLAAQAVSVV